MCMAKKPIIRGKRPHNVQIPKLIDSFTVKHLATFPLPRLRGLKEVVESPTTRAKIAEAISLLEGKSRPN